MYIRKKFSGQVILLSIFILFMLVTVINNFISQINTINEYKEKISVLKNDINEVKAQIEEVNSIKNNSTDNIEKIARKSLNMIKQGEVIYIDINREGE